MTFYNLTVESSYPTPYVSSPFLYLILMSMSGQRHAPRTTDKISDQYDYVVVGGGVAGSIVAARLSEKNCVSVLVLEAGKAPPKVTDIPVAARSFIQTDIDWNYITAPQENAALGHINQTVAWPSGKALGGSSVLHAMLNVRGNKKNYNDWAAMGATGWSYNEILPYLKKMEDNANFEYVANGYHGVGGPMTVSRPEYSAELQSAVWRAARNKGYDVIDSNGPTQTGFFDLQAQIRQGQRCSAAKAYLVPADNRPNLDIVADAFVKKIPVIADLPVGKNLQDHWLAILNFELNENIKPFAEKLVDNSSIWQYIHTKTGPLASAQGVSTIAFLDKDGPYSPDDFGDYQLYFWEGAVGPAEYQFRLKPEYFEAIYEPYRRKPFYMCLSQILHPKGRGEVTLQSANPYDPPIIDPKYYSDPEDLDIVVAGLKKCKEFGESDELKEIGSKPFSTPMPGCEDVKEDENEYLRCVARSIVMTLNHQVATATMGDPSDPNTVLDPKLRVKNIENLRVVDASAIPLVTSGNTVVPTMVIAEKAADLIKENIFCKGDGWRMNMNFWTSMHMYGPQLSWEFRGK